MIKIFVLIMALAVIIPPIFPQDMPLYFNHLTRDDGLSSNRVNCIFEDSEGFLWFGTENGLSRYDGYSFQVFRNDPADPESILDNIVDVIVENKKTGNLWIATSRGPVIFDRSRYVFDPVRIEEMGTPGENSPAILSMCFADSIHLWMGTNQGLYVFDISGYRLVRHFLPDTARNGSLGGIRVNALYMDSKGIIWIGHTNGVDYVMPEDTVFKHFQPGSGMADIRSILEDRGGDLWFGSDVGGLYHFRKDQTGILDHLCVENGQLSANRVHGILELSDSVMVILVRDGGLYTFSRNSGILAAYMPDNYAENSINSMAIISSLKSSHGIIWIGTYNSGINYIDSKRKNFEHFKIDFRENGLFNQNIRALCEDSEGKIWIGTKEGGGLSSFDRKTRSFKNYRKSDRPEGLHDDYIFSICEMDKNHLMIGTFKSGLAIFNKSRGTFRYFLPDPSDPLSLSHNRVYSVYRDVNGALWIGTQPYLQKFSPADGTFTPIRGVEVPRCFAMEDSVRMWIGSRNSGLYLYDTETGEYRNYRFNPEDESSIPSNDIIAVEKSGNGDLWIGTRSGLCLYDRGKDGFLRFTEKDGLPADWICGLEIDDQQNVWVSTVNGVSKYNRASGVFKNYDVADGLQGKEFEPYVSLKTRDGQILFGGRNGFNMFLPENITDNTEIPRIVLTGFKLSNKEVPVALKGSPLQKNIGQTDRIRLKHNQSAFTIDYSVLNYTSPEKNRYAYRLHGFDPEWIQAGTNRSAVYTHIPPGSYTFQVIASNNDGYWNEEGRSLKIQVLPPPWRTVWAYLFYAAVLIGIMLLIRRMLIIRIEQNKLIEFERKDKARIQEMNQMKLRFFTNISHEFRTPLVLISGPLEKLMSFRDENAEKRYLMKTMHNNVKRLLMLINELMDFRKAENEKLRLHVGKHDLSAFIHDIIECFDEHAIGQNKSISFLYDVPEPQESWFDKNIMDKVLFNLLSNAIKYTPDGGKIKVNLAIEGDDAVISIADTGKGISPGEINEIFQRFYQVEEKSGLNVSGSGIGLAFSKRLIEAHYGKIEVASQVGEGSTFTVRFPVSRHSYSEEEIKDQKDAVPEFTDEFSGLLDTSPPDVKYVKTDGQENLKLLIVEDNEELVSYLKNSFSTFDVSTASNGEEGYRLALKEVPDIIISDIMMPEMDGNELCAKIKTQMATSHIPVILLTAKTDISHKILGLETGADAYVDKPFNLDYLKATVRNLLKQREALRRKFSSEPELDINELGLSSHEIKFIEKTLKVIDENIENPDFSVESLGLELGLSRSQLFRKCRSLFEMQPSELIRLERLKKARSILATRNYNVNEVADQTGFKSSSYFITSFKKHFRQTPKEYLRSLRK